LVARPRKSGWLIGIGLLISTHAWADASLPGDPKKAQPAGEEWEIGCVNALCAARDTLAAHDPRFNDLEIEVGGAWTVATLLYWDEPERLSATVYRPGASEDAGRKWHVTHKLADHVARARANVEMEIADETEQLGEAARLVRAALDTCVELSHHKRR
jgi:hypothetical protein